jgi:hypothetical protein
VGLAPAAESILVRIRIRDAVSASLVVLYVTESIREFIAKTDDNP